MISVIVPTFNRALLVKEAIQCVLAQTHQDFELIVVDDHSTDDTKRVVEQIAQQDSRVIYRLNERTKGAQGARNTGIFQAAGEWLAFLDSDDLWHPKRLEAHMRLVQELNDPELAGTMTQSGWDGKGDHDLGRVRDRLHSVKTEQVLYRNTVGGFSSLVCKRCAAVEIGGVDERFQSMQDVDFYAMLTSVGKLLQICIPLVQIRKGEWARITGNFPKKLNGARLIEEKHHRTLQSSLRLRLRASNRVLRNAMLCKEYGEAAGRIPRFALTFLVDPVNALSVLKDFLTRLKAILTR